jgi:hypothetical protein
MGSVGELARAIKCPFGMIHGCSMVQSFFTWINHVICLCGTVICCRASFTNPSLIVSIRAVPMRQYSVFPDKRIWQSSPAGVHSVILIFAAPSLQDQDYNWKWIWRLIAAQKHKHNLFLCNYIFIPFKSYYFFKKN